MHSSTEFWFEYITAAREFYLTGRPVDANVDPMLAAMVEWLKKIETAMQKAASEGCQYFSCRQAFRARNPTPLEIRAIVKGLEGDWRPLLLNGDLHRTSRLLTASPESIAFFYLKAENAGTLP